MTATHPISTDNGLGQHVDTEHQSGQTTPEWVRSHEDDCENALPLAGCGSLETSWTTSSGYRMKKSVRDAGEDNIPFLLRNQIESLQDMQNGHAPIP